VESATLTRGATGFLFTVSSGANLILENIIIDGDRHGSFTNGGNSLVRVLVRGTLVMEDGAVLRNNTFLSSTGGAVYVNDGSVQQGSAAFIMNGGLIIGNTVTGQGGGVRVGSRSTFTMNGGEISGNTAGGIGGGVRTSGTFTMNGGKIIGNTSTSQNSGGGGVYASGDTLTITDGEISGNTANEGGGVFAFATFTMTGGKINDNTAKNGGGGVYITGNTSTITDGEISGNTANEGGGVYASFGTLNILGGKINDNTALIGGGVHVRTNSTFIMDGGEISGNTAGDEETPGLGGGVHTIGQFILNNGKIINNNAISPTIPNNDGGPSYGGGVYVDGLFTNHGNYLFAMMNGGEISGNTADSGDNVYVYNGTFVVVTGATGIVTDGLYEYDATAVSEAPIVIKWNRPSGEGLFEYDDGTSTDLTVEPTGATAVWGIAPVSWSDKFGIIFERTTSDTTNAGFIEMDVLLSGNTTAVKVIDREIPNNNNNSDVAVIVPVVISAGELTAGPNPVARSSGEVNFYWNGRRVNDAVLTVFDAAGNVVGGVNITNCADCRGAINRARTAEPTESRRGVGSWDLTDRRGRLVSEGSYLVRGTVTTSDGKRERVSVVISVR
jgi:hypothetical protein